MAQQILDGHIRTGQAKQLTPRQREVLRFLGEGRTLEETAAVLHITSRTVYFHKRSLMQKFGLKNYPDLVRFAIKEHLVALD